MPLSSFAQLSLAGTLALSQGALIASVTPPNPYPDTTLVPKGGDLVRAIGLTGPLGTKALLAPFSLAAFHAVGLAYCYPSIPAKLLGYAPQNGGLDRALLTWSPATILPLAIILAVGAPLRLISYSHLGKNFKFAIVQPDQLTTTGIYAHVQHPSYTAVFLLFLAELALVCRPGGVLSCWLPPALYRFVDNWKWWLGACCTAGFSMVFAMRVAQEEHMLRAEFGQEWEAWHAKTPRFIPWLF